MLSKPKKVARQRARWSYLRNENRKYDVIQGCSAAYKKWVFDLPVKWVFDLPVKPTIEDYAAEDLLFSFYLNLIGAGIRRLDYPLVEYRAHPDALTNFRNRPTSATQGERRSRREAKATLQLLDDFRDIALVLGKVDMMDRIAFEQARAAAQEIIDWPDLSFPQRLKRALTIDLRGNGQTSKWRFARLWGRHPNYQPKILLSRFQKQYR